MSTSQLYCYGKTPRRLHQGPLGAYIDRVAARYIEQGYRRDYAAAAVAAVDQFGRWLEACGLKPRDIDEQMLDRYVQRNSARLHPSTRIALRHLLDVLREVDACPPPALVARAPDQILEDDFGEFLVKERGLAARTVEHYTEAARIFLAACSAEERRERSTWTAADVLTFVQLRAQVRKPVHMQQLCTGLRAFLRYLRFRGEIRSDLASSVPRIARWRLATLPKSLSRAQVQQVLTHYKRRHTAAGRRNYTVLMLLVRLGLRAHEIWSLTLDDIDWRNGHLTIRSKGTGAELMPLPTDVGKALTAYLTDGRPASRSRAVFVRLHPPHTQLAGSGSVTTIAARAFRAAGVDAPCKGAHVFRYTLATQMLRHGASLREIGQVLRHRDEDTTRIYAKVDLTRLRTLAMPWPGGAS